MLAGQLEIDLVAGVAQFSKDMAQMRRDVTGHMSAINDAVALTKKGLEALGVTLTVGFAVDFVKSSIEATARMKELGTQAGTTAEAISRFELPARAAGSSLDAVSLAMFRMSKAAVEAQDPTTKSATALKAIGLSTKDFQDLKPDQIFELVARRLATFSDGVQKNAVEQVLFNRSGAEMSRVIAEIAANGQLAATVTNEQAKQANELTTKITELKMQSEQLTRGVLADWVPAFTRIVESVKQARQESGLLAAAWVALGGAAAEIAGLNDSDAQKFRKGLQDAQEQIVEFKAHISVERQQELLAGLVQPINLIEASFMRANQQARLLEETMNAYKGMYDDQASRAARQGQVLSPGQSALNFDPTGGQSDAFAVSSLARATRELAQARAEAATDSMPLTQAEKTLIALESDPKWKDLSKTTRDNITSLLGQAKTVEQTTQATKDLAEAQAQLNAIDEETQKEVDAIMDRGKDRLTALDDEIDAYTRENGILGAGNLARELLNLDLQKERDLRNVVNQDTRDGITAKYDELKALAAQRDEIQAQLSAWNQIGDAVGQFFNSILLQGTHAIDALRNLVKQLLADMISVFAKRWLLQLAASATGSSALASAAGQAGSSAAGSILGNAATSAIGSAYTSGVGSSFLGSAGAAGATELIGSEVIGTSAAAGASTAAGAGATAYGALSSVLSAIPVWGWIALAVIAIAAYFGGKGGGPKTGGSSFGTFDETGKFIGNAPVPGSDNGRFYTPDQLDPQMAQYSQAVAQSYVAAVNRYGGTALGLNIGAGTDSDPQGSAQSRISGIVVNRATGAVIYHNQDQSMDDKAVPAGLALQAQQMVVAALQQSNLPQYLANVFKGVNALTLTQDQINNLFAMADALKGIMDVATRDPMADAAQAFTDSMDQFDATLRNNGLSIRSVMDAYDGTTTSAQNLQQATTAYYNAQVQLLNQLMQAKQSIDAMFGDTFRGFKLAGMTDQQKYDFYQSEAATLEQQALASTDPAEIQRLVQQINQDEQAAFALLTPEQQAGAEGQAFIAKGTAAQQAIDDHIDHITQAVSDATKDVLGEIKTLISGPTDSMNSAANTMNGAANTIADSADKPLHVIVDNYGTQQVTG